MRKLKDFKLIKDSKTGLMIREPSCDADTLKYVRHDYCDLDYENQVVMDIGGCFGAFADFALRKGAGEVIVYEPDPVNWDLLKLNMEDEWERVTLINAAIVGGDEETVTFYQSSTKSFGIGTMVETRGRNKMTVEARNFLEALEENRPSVIKIDCEGGEYDFLLGVELPSFVKQVVMEIHLTKKGWRENEAPDLISQFDFDWECVKEPRITAGNWATIGAWIR